MTTRSLLAWSFVALLPACAHNEAAPSSSEPAAAAQTKEPRIVGEIRKRAAFDLGCTEEQIQVQQLQKGSLMNAASYGASCGEKRVSYLERAGNIIKQ